MENMDHIFKNCPFVEGIWDRIKFDCPTPFFFFKVIFLFFILSWIDTIYKNYKINCKIFNHPMEKIAIIL